MTITINPKNKKELKKIKTVLKAIEVEFHEKEKDYSQEFIDEIHEAEAQIKNGEFTTLKSKEDVKHFFNSL